MTCKIEIIEIVVSPIEKVMEWRRLYKLIKISLKSIMMIKNNLTLF